MMRERKRERGEERKKKGQEVRRKVRREEGKGKKERPFENSKMLL